MSSHHKEDILWFGINQIIYPLTMAVLSINIGHYTSKILSSYSNFFDLTKSPIALQIIVFVLLTDFVSYWLHRAFHRIKPMWEMHRLHHSITELTAISSFRNSWADFTINSFLFGLATGFFAVNNNIRVYVTILFSLVCIVQHVNLNFKYPKFIEYIFITPKNHFWHHSKELHHSHGQNFGFLFPWWDMLFRTLHNPDNFNTELGFSDEFEYKSFFRKFIHPLDKWLGF